MVSLGSMGTCASLALFLYSLPVPCGTTFFTLLGHGPAMLNARPGSSWNEHFIQGSGAQGLAEQVLLWGSGQGEDCKGLR